MTQRTPKGRRVKHWGTFTTTVNPISLPTANNDKQFVYAYHTPAGLDKKTTWDLNWNVGQWSELLHLRYKVGISCWDYTGRVKCSLTFVSCCLRCKGGSQLPWLLVASFAPGQVQELANSFPFGIRMDLPWMTRTLHLAGPLLQTLESSGMKSPNLWTGEVQSRTGVSPTMIDSHSRMIILPWRRLNFVLWSLQS